MNIRNTTHKGEEPLASPLGDEESIDSKREIVEGDTQASDRIGPAIEGNAARELDELRHQDIDILVRERQEIPLSTPVYPWPDDLPRASQGEIGLKPNKVFRLILKWLKSYRDDVEWIPFFKSAGDSRNSLFQSELMVATLERIFAAQLQANFNPAQRLLLEEADIIVVCFDPALNSIVSYGSTRFSEVGSIPGIAYQISHGGHMIVAQANERRRLAPFTAVVLALYGHKFLDLFRKEIIVLRTNNKYVERLIRRVEPIYRSDRITPDRDDFLVGQVIKAMRWTDQEVFHAQENLVFGRPLKINHRFSEDVTIDGLRPDEIIYLARVSSLGYFLYRLARGAKNPK